MIYNPTIPVVTEAEAEVEFVTFKFMTLLNAIGSMSAMLAMPSSRLLRIKTGGT